MPVMMEDYDSATMTANQHGYNNNIGPSASKVLSRHVFSPNTYQGTAAITQTFEMIKAVSDLR